MIDGTQKNMDGTATDREQRLSDRRLSLALFLTAAGLSLITSIAVFVGGDRQQGLFIGLWVPSIIGLGHLLLQGVNDE